MSFLACMVVEKSLTKNFILQSMEGKKRGQIQGKIGKRSLVLNPTIQQVVINLHTINMSILAFMVAEKSLTKNFILQSMEGKKRGQMQGRISRRSWFSILRYIKSSSTCIPNMSILACMVVEKSLTKNFILQSMEGKKSGQMQGRISWRRLHGFQSHDTIVSRIRRLMTLTACCIVGLRTMQAAWFSIPRYNKLSMSSACVSNMSNVVRYNKLSMSSACVSNMSNAHI